MVDPVGPVQRSRYVVLIERWKVGEQAVVSRRFR
jgi:hypothetical protein